MDAILRQNRLTGNLPGLPQIEYRRVTVWTRLKSATWQWGRLIEIRHGAGPRPAGVAAASAGARSRGARGGRSFGLHRKYGQLGCQVLTLAFRAAGFLVSQDQGFEARIAVVASVFKYWHYQLPRKRLRRTPALKVSTVLTRFTSFLADARFYLIDLSFPTAHESALLQQGAFFFKKFFPSGYSLDTKFSESPNPEKLNMELL